MRVCVCLCLCVEAVVVVVVVVAGVVGGGTNGRAAQNSLQRQELHTPGSKVELGSKEH